MNEEPRFRRDILDHGYIQDIEEWGSDQRIIESARMSTDKGFLGWGPKVTGLPCFPNGDVSGKPREELPDFLVDVWRANGCPSFQDATNPFQDVKEGPGDEGLLRYLWEKQHSTPFEMAGLTIEVQCPIFVIREWHRHRVPFGYSELSARYAPMPNLNYVPTIGRCLRNSDGKNKQAGALKGSDQLTPEAAVSWRKELEHFYEMAEALYLHGLKIGMPKELARVVIPVGRYTRMRATGNLRGWLAFIKLRNAPDAQEEIRLFAEVVSEILQIHFPRTHEIVTRTMVTV
jgi:thymidylate synthase (FAD)